MKIKIALAVIIAIVGFVFFKQIHSILASTGGKPDKNKDERSSVNTAGSSQIAIIEKFDLPDELKEVSGISFMGRDRFACVQDELGNIYIYNTSSNSIEKKIEFAGAGDYEGIAVKNNIAYVVRADGLIYEVDINAGKSSVKEYKTPLTVKHNIEGLCYDADNDRLLLGIKDDEPGNPGYKGIYAFDLSNKKMKTEPVYKIDLSHELITSGGNGKKNTIMPSEIGIHPTSKDVYVLDGPNSRLLLMDKDGNMKEFYTLGKDFEQPEGITFSPEGNIFVSNEGTKKPANIIQIELRINQ